MKTISLYPVLVKWKESFPGEATLSFRTNVGYCEENLVWNEVPDHIEETIFWWSDEVPYVGMDLDDALIIALDGEPETITLGGE
jgi:hypothetical protein